MMNKSQIKKIMEISGDLSEFDIPSIDLSLNRSLSELESSYWEFIDKTEGAANKTMDAVDRCMPIADNLHEGLLQVRPQWNELMHGRIELNEFKALCHRIDTLLGEVEGDSSELRGQLTEILMAQDFQDLTGQVIRRVIELLREVEESLIHMLKVFGSPLDGKSSKSEVIEEKDIESSLQVEKELDQVAEGPIIDALERDDVVSDQDDVDDLLSSLGF